MQIAPCVLLKVSFLLVNVYSAMSLVALRKNIFGKNFSRRFASPVQKVKHLLRFIIWTGIKRGQPCRLTSIEGPMNGSKFVSVVVNTLPEFCERMSSEEVIISQDNTLCHVSRQVSKYIDSQAFDWMLFAFRLVKDFKTQNPIYSAAPGGHDLNFIEKKLPFWKKTSASYLRIDH